MQCPSCKFNNMPGTTHCGRCASILDANTIAIDVHPPRASASAKRMRKVVRGLSINRVGDTAQCLRGELAESLHRRGFQHPPLPAVPRMIVPGWALIHVGERIRGWAFFGLAAIMVCLGFLFLGSVFGNVCLGIAFGVHVGSCVSFLRQGGFGQRDAASLGLIVVVGLLALYVPAGWLISQFATPITMNIAATPFAHNDVLLLNQRAFAVTPPRPGDIVLHHVTARQLRLPGPIPYFVREGQTIDRILANGGDEVRWENSKLWVNNRETDLQPLNPSRLPDKLTWNVPAEHVLIVPTASVAIQYPPPPEFWQQLSYVPVNNVVGRVYFRTYPPSRWGRIR